MQPTAGCSQQDQNTFRTLHTNTGEADQQMRDISTVLLNAFCFEEPSPTNADIKMIWLRVFDYPSRVNHSCEPNATFVTLEHGRLTIVALKEIPAGDEIEINYIGRGWLWSRGKRQKELAKSYGFPCTCHGCAATDAWRLKARANREALGWVRDPSSSAAAPARHPSAYTRQANATELCHLIHQHIGYDMEWVDA